MKFFPEVDYLALKTMAIDQDVSDDERNPAVDENKEEDDEFSTYFSDARVNIPENDKVSINMK